MNNILLSRREVLISGAAMTLALTGCSGSKPKSALPAGAFLGRADALRSLRSRVADTGLSYGAPLHIMAFKEEKEMELWLGQEDGTYELFETIPICFYSGILGPKLKEGDGQTPEGYYSVEAKDLYPNSGLHLALELNFPNRFDRQHNRTGSWIRIHGGCESIGCFAMTDDGIETIYLLAEAALANGAPKISVASYPFRPTERRLAEAKDHEWYPFWRNLAGSYSFFLKNHRPPVMRAAYRRYYFTAT